MTRLAATSKDARKIEQPARHRRPEPRPTHSWEPIPLHVPQPEAPSRRKPPVLVEDIEEPRGVVIIDYGE